MNVLDENILAGQRVLLRRWRVAVRHIGFDVGRPSMTDAEIIPLLHQLRRPTLFTRDFDFYRRSLLHERYCLVWLDVGAAQVAEYTRRLLRHPEFDTQAKRMGSIVRVSWTGIAAWRLHAASEARFSWRRGKRN